MHIEYEGRCHCGAIGYRYRTPVDPSAWTVRACDCSFCRLHDALSASGEAAEIEFFAKTSERLTRYRFGLRTADFLVCSACGVYIGAMASGANGTVGIVNLRALVASPQNLAAVVPVSYAGEDRATRIARRERRWAKARFVPGPAP